MHAGYSGRSGRGGKKDGSELIIEVRMRRGSELFYDLLFFGIPSVNGSVEDGAGIKHVDVGRSSRQQSCRAPRRFGNGFGDQARRR